MIAAMVDQAFQPHQPSTSQAGQVRGPWRVVSTREAYQNPWIRVPEDQVVRPDGNPGLYGVVELKAAVGVIPVTPDGRVYLVGQYRYATERYSWEVVSGFAEPGESMVEGARRELREEAGLIASRWGLPGGLRRLEQRHGPGRLHLHRSRPQ